MATDQELEEWPPEAKPAVYLAALTTALELAVAQSGPADIHAALAALARMEASLIAKLDRNARRQATEVLDRARRKDIAALVNARLLKQGGGNG